MGLHVVAVTSDHSILESCFSFNFSRMWCCCSATYLPVPGGLHSDIFVLPLPPLTPRLALAVAGLGLEARARGSRARSLTIYFYQCPRRTSYRRVRVRAGEYCRRI